MSTNSIILDVYMPKSLAITVSELEYLKNALEKLFSVSIKDTNDCKNISHLIQDQYGFLISYNTLRRLFKVIPSNSGISLHSLNLISQTLGHKSWAALQNSFHQHKIAHRNHLVQYFKRNKAIDHDSILQIIQFLKLADWEDSYWLKVMVKLAVDLKDFDLIQKILLHPFDIVIGSDHDKLYFGMQDIFYELPQNKKLADLLIQNVRSSPLIQFIFCECYVNEAELNGYYGELLEGYIQAKKSENHAQIFYKLLMCQKRYINGEEPEKIKELFQQAVEIFQQSDPNSISSILKGRIAAWEWILYADNTIYKLLAKDINTGLDWAHFKDFYHRLTITYGNKKQVPYLIEVPEEFANKHLESLSFFEERMFTHEYLQMAINFYLNKNDKQATFWLKKVKPLNFDITMLDWYSGWYKKLKKELKA